MVLLLWLPFGPKNGMGYETGFAYDSDTSSFWHGFFYSDPLRPYTSVFYNLGYHLSAWLGIPGSFLGYQLVYAALWFGRGFLAYLIVRALFPRNRVFAVLIGLIVLVHASDRATNWVGQMNQYGMIFWTLLSIYLLIRALKAATFLPTVIFTLGSMWAVRMALWSYESALFIIFLVPLMLLVFRFRFRLRPVLIVCAYYISPVSYVWDSYQRYSANGSSTYQQSVLRSNMSPGPILSDWWFNITNSLEFWNWSRGMPAVTAPAERHVLGLAGAALAAVVVAGAALTAKRRGATLPDRRSLVNLLICGLVILAASFPAYVILSSARELWRTQFSVQHRSRARARFDHRPRCDHRASKLGRGGDRGYRGRSDRVLWRAGILYRREFRVRHVDQGEAHSRRGRLFGASPRTRNGGGPRRRASG